MGSGGNSESQLTVLLFASLTPPSGSQLRVTRRETVQVSLFALSLMNSDQDSISSKASLGLHPTNPLITCSVAAAILALITVPFSELEMYMAFWSARASPCANHVGGKAQYGSEALEATSTLDPHSQQPTKTCKRPPLLDTPAPGQDADGPTKRLTMWRDIRGVVRTGPAATLSDRF